MVFRNFGTEQHDVRTCIDGVNEQVSAASRNQCVDARNVWERGGRLVQRPGTALAPASPYWQPPGQTTWLDPWAVAALYPGLLAYQAEFQNRATKIQHLGIENTGVFTWASEVTASGADGQVIADNAAVGDSVYFGFDRPVTAFGVWAAGMSNGGNAAGFAASYWDGSAWQTVVMKQSILRANYADGVGATNGIIFTREDSVGADNYFLRRKAAWAYSDPFEVAYYTKPTPTAQVARTLDTQPAAYWWKLTVTNATLTAGAVVLLSWEWNNGWGVFPNGGLRYHMSIFRESSALNWLAGAPVVAAATFPTSQRIFLVGALCNGRGAVYASTESLEDSVRWLQWDIQGPVRPVGSIAVDVQGGRAYIALSGRVTKHLAVPHIGGSIVADVETADWAIGPGAPYDKNSIDLLHAFPAASLIAWFQNRLWFGAIEGEPNAIRWSAAAPYNEVIPSLAVEYLDQPPTAMKPLGENMVIYTQDNIYLSVLDSVDDFAVPHYKFIKVVAGRGCVAQNSVVEINGRHIFLSEDGLYAFDGTSRIQKITLQNTYTALGGTVTGSIDRLESTFASLNRGARQGAYGVHWRSERVALFSIPVGGSSTNNRIVVWDYERDKFWLWDGLNAQALLNVNTNTTDEKIYFFTAGGGVYRLDRALLSDDATPISTYIVTSPIGMRDSMHKQVTEIKVLAGNATGQLTVSAYPNGLAAQAKVGTLKFLDPHESLVGTMVIGRDKLASTNIRFRHTHFRADGSYFQVKVAGAASAAKPFDMVNMDIGYINKYEDTR